MSTIKTEEGAGGDGSEVSPLRMMLSHHTTCILDCSLCKTMLDRSKCLGLKPILSSTC